MIKSLINTLRQRPAGFLDQLYWSIALVSLIPAIRADLLFPHTWSTSLSDNYSMPLIDNPFGLWVFGLALISLLLVVASQKKWRALATASFVSIGLADSALGAAVEGVNSIYVGVAFALFVYFVVAGRVKSVSFFLVIVLLGFLQQFDNQLAWPQILVFAVIAVVASLVVETVRQNWPLARQLGRSNLLELTGRTVKLWWPMLILIAIGTWISDTITTSTEEALYAVGVVEPYCYVDAVGSDAILACPNNSLQLKNDSIRSVPVDEMTYVCRVWPNYSPEEQREPPPKTFICPSADPAPEFWPLTRLGFFDSLDRSVERDYDIREWTLNRQILAVRAASVRTATGAGGEAKRLFGVIPGTTGMETSSCNFLELKCYAANIVIGELNSAYENARRDSEKKFVSYVQEKANNADENFGAFTNDVHEEMSGVLNQYERRTRAAIGRVHTASNITRQVLILWLIVIAIKSFLFVFARVIFDKSTDIKVDLLEHDGEFRQGAISQVQEVDIESGYPYTLYYKANYQPLGPAPRFSIPQWRASVLSRLRFGAWHMSQVRMPLQDGNSVTFNSIEGEHLVDWTLQEGEEVVFNYRNFVAMNENIELQTVVSLRVATLLLGRIVFHTARCKGGHGRLILRTRGKPATAAQVRQSIPAARLVAWNRYAKFSVDSHLTPADIFLNGFNLRRTANEDTDDPQGILVVEADARDGGILVGTLRFAKTFLLPV